MQEEVLACGRIQDACQPMRKERKETVGELKKDLKNVGFGNVNVKRVEKLAESSCFSWYSSLDRAFNIAADLLGAVDANNK
jgi:hypothetical protein